MIPTRFERAVRYDRKGRAAQWHVCAYAYRIVGGRDGNTAAFAERVGRSVSMIENYAHAFELMLRLWQYGVSYSLRSKLHISHYYAMWDLERKHDLPLMTTFEYLMEAAEERYSVEALRKLVDEQNGGGVTLEKRLKRMYNDASYLVTDGAITGTLYRIMLLFVRWYNDRSNRD